MSIPLHTHHVDLDHERAIARALHDELARARARGDHQLASAMVAQVSEQIRRFATLARAARRRKG